MENQTQVLEPKKAIEKTTISGAEAVIKSLLEEGVKLAYGYPGGAIMPIYDEIYKYEGIIKLFR